MTNGGHPTETTPKPIPPKGGSQTGKPKPASKTKKARR
jgi:hypothetical protein